MRRVRILTKGLSDDEIAEISKLVRQSGCPSEEIDATSVVEDPIQGCDDEIIIVSLSATVCADPMLEDELSKTPNGARRVICVWPKDLNGEAEPPSAALKYSYSIIPWSADKLRTAVADDDALCFEKPTGEPLPKVDTERNLCVDEDAA